VARPESSKGVVALSKNPLELNAMNDVLEIVPIAKPVFGSVTPPGSKSITNRALAMASLAKGTTTLQGALESVDTQVMQASLRKLGVAIESTSENRLTVSGNSGVFSVENASLDIENSGTSMRFLTAFCGLGNGTICLDGNTRMRERPIGDLVDALRQLGANISYEREEGFPPLKIEAVGLNGGNIRIAGNISSQFLSALLTVAPYARSEITIEVEGELVSKPYVAMTLRVMKEFGLVVEKENDSRFRIEPAVYSPRIFTIEPDASAASYFFALAAITQGSVTVRGLTRRSMQGDIAFVDLLERMGCEVTETQNAIAVQGKPLSGIDIDMNDVSDTVPTLAVVAVTANGPTTIRNVEHIRHKETDRIGALVTELNRLGIETDETQDGLTIHPGTPQPGSVKTYDDHRMAMSFALLGLKYPGIEIEDPHCTAKTYPNYFNDLKKLTHCQYR